MREVMVAWPEERHLSCLSQGIDFSIRNQRIWMPLEGSITTPDDESVLPPDCSP